MSDDLSALIRAAAHEDEVAAGGEFPYSAATLGRHVRDVRRRRVAGGAMLAAAGVLVLGGAAFGVDRLLAVGSPSDVAIGDPTSTVTSTPDWTATPSPTPSPTPSATPTPTPSATPSAPVETVAPPADEPPPPPVEPVPDPPGAVTVNSSGPGGGSGEVMVTWAPTDGATGYRVYRADAAEGPFTLSATFDVATAATTVAFSGGYEYITIWQPLSGDYLDLQYVEAISGARAYFRVTAFNAGGEGPMSGVYCGMPQTGIPTEC